jgi:hypothetical protein
MVGTFPTRDGRPSRVPASIASSFCTKVSISPIGSSSADAPLSARNRMRVSSRIPARSSAAITLPIPRSIASTCAA